MAYQFLWIDGFDYEDDFSEVYLTGTEYGYNGAKFSGSDVPYGYGKATALNSAPGGGGNYIHKLLPGAPFTTLFVGFHWYWDDTSDPYYRRFIDFLDIGNNYTQALVERNYVGLHKLRLVIQSNVVGQTSVGITPGQWTWVSFKCYSHPTSGNVQIRINDVNALNYNGNTAPSGVAQLHNVRINTDVQVGTGFRIDNLVIATGDPSDPPLPELRVLGAIVPNANDSVQFTPNAGSNWSNVDEIGPDEDATYNSSSTVGHTDTFSGATSPVGDDIYAVKVNVRAKKDNPGERSFCPVIKPTTTVYEGAETTATPTYFTYGHIWQTNPETGNPWTQAEISNLKWGYRLKG